jgi:hypothetical protein
VRAVLILPYALVLNHSRLKGNDLATSEANFETEKMRCILGDGLQAVGRQT